MRSSSEPEPRPRLRSIITTTSTSDTITERRIENVTEGLSSQYLNLLHRMLPANKAELYRNRDSAGTTVRQPNLQALGKRSAAVRAARDVGILPSTGRYATAEEAPPREEAALHLTTNRSDQ